MASKNIIMASKKCFVDASKQPSANFCESTTFRKFSINLHKKKLFHSRFSK